jgi:transposase InsO family protein
MRVLVTLCGLEYPRSFIELGTSWENGYMESFFGKLRDEFHKGELFDTLLEARVRLLRVRASMKPPIPAKSPNR